MDQHSNPFAVNPYEEHEARTRAWWAGLTLEEQSAFLVEIGIYTADGKLHPNYDHHPLGGRSGDAEAK
jgi:hypothetical protein